MVRRLSALLLLAAAGCSSDLPTTDLFTVSGALAGVVSDTTGRPVLRASIRAATVLGAGPGYATGGATITDGTGQFAFLVTLGQVADTTISLNVEVTAAGYSTLDVNGVQLHLSRATSPDTTHLILTLHP